jgi:copper chaperone CopZ/predicted peroxiredoxin
VVVGVVAFLAGVFAPRLVNRADDVKAEGGQAATASTREFAIEGMSCQGCVDAITAALTEIPGVHSAKVSLGDKKAVVIADERKVPNAKIVAAIEAAGYKGQLSTAAKAAKEELAATPASRKQPILVNITRGKSELHAVSMALGLAQSAINDGRTATVFLNVEAPAFAAKDADKNLKFADFPPIQKMLTDFIAKGGRVLVCGHCAHVGKLEQKSMIDGVKLIGHGELLNALPSDTVVFSY